MKRIKMKRVNNPRNKLIEFGSTFIGTDDEGFDKKEWQTINKSWANVRSLRGREFEAAASIQSEDKKVFNCNYFSGLNTNIFIRYNNKIYNIYHIDNVNEDNIEYNIYAASVDSSE